MADISSVAATGDSLSALLSLGGALNFREISGQSSLDHRVVRRSLLYRSGTTHAINQQGLDRITTLGIRHVYDLRSSSERRRSPSLLRSIENVHYEFADHNELPGDIVRMAASTAFRRDDARQAMLNLYAQLPRTFAAAYRRLFLKVSACNLPLLFNCTAGKDRTGVAAAILLSTLGVSRDQILEDYMVSNQSIDDICRVSLFRDGQHMFEGMALEDWEPLIRSESHYLKAMFDSITGEFGSVKGYVERCLGLSNDDQRRIRCNLLNE